MRVDVFSSRGQSKDTARDTPTLQNVPAPLASAGNRVPVRVPTAVSIFSSELTIEGSLTSEGDVHIDGRVKGGVTSAGLIIGDKAEVYGDVIAENLTIRGRILGNIRARKVLLCSSCHVEGDILHEAFAVEAGAFFEGNCRHSSDCLAGTARPKREQAYSTRPAVSQPALASNLAATVRGPVPPTGTRPTVSLDAMRPNAALPPK